MLKILFYFMLESGTLHFAYHCFFITHDFLRSAGVCQ